MENNSYNQPNSYTIEIPDTGINESGNTSGQDAKNMVVKNDNQGSAVPAAGSNGASGADNQAGSNGVSGADNQAGSNDASGTDNQIGSNTAAAPDSPTAQGNRQIPPYPTPPAKPKKKKGKKTALIVVGIIVAVFVLLIGGCVYLVNKGMKALSSFNSPNVIEIEKQDLMNYIGVSGKVESQNKVNITSTLTGTTIEKLNVEVGDYVKKGDVLCEFENDDLEKQYDSTLKQVQGTAAYEAYLARKMQKNLNDAKSDKSEALSDAQTQVDAAKARRDSAYTLYNAHVAAYNEDVNLLKSLNEEKTELEKEVTSEEPTEAPVENPEDTGSKEDTGAGTKDTGDTTETDNSGEKTPAERLAEINSEIAALSETIKEEAEAIAEEKAGLAAFDEAVASAESAYKEIAKTADSAIDTAKDVIEESQYKVEDNTLINTLEELDRKLDECKVTAPMDGIITSLNVAEGSMAGTDVIMTIEDSKKLKITVAIDEGDILKLKEGQKAVIKTTATGDKEFSGKVTKVVNVLSVDPTGQTGGYSAEIEIGDKDTELLIGMSATGKIVLDEKENVISVPYESILTDDKDQEYVFIAEEVPGQSGVYIARQTYIKKGMETSYYVEVVEGLKEGDKVVTTPDMVAADQQFVVIDFSTIYSTTEEEEK